jgi:hypothetical protein
MRMQASAWIVMLSLAVAGVPCGAWSTVASAHDCCDPARPAPAHAEMTGGHHDMQTATAGHDHASGGHQRATAIATTTDTIAASPGTHGPGDHRMPAGPVAVCCVSSSDPGGDQAVPATAAAFVLTTPAATIHPAGLPVPSPEVWPPGPIAPPSTTPRYLLLSVFLV